MTTVVSCLRCTNDFESIDKRYNRICKKCAVKNNSINQPKIIQKTITIRKKLT